MHGNRGAPKTVKARYYCENCGTEVRAGAASCPRCMRIFAAVRCPECGYEGKAADFKKGCPTCGYMQPREQTLPGARSGTRARARTARPARPSLLSARLSRMAIAALLVVLAALIALLLLRR